MHGTHGRLCVVYFILLFYFKMLEWAHRNSLDHLCGTVDYDNISKATWNDEDGAQFFIFRTHGMA